MIGDVECPMPETEELGEGDMYYSASFDVVPYYWCNCDIDTNLLKKGLVFLNREDAEKTAEAIFKLTRI
jgi:hypothetical protein